VHVADVSLRSVRDYAERTFGPLAADKGLGLDVEIAADAPKTIATDEVRLQQVLKNLLSNAVKFTENGGVVMRIGMASDDVQFASPELAAAENVIAFSVTDTGIGIHDDKLNVIFEAFQQADGTTSRRYGGTGLGLNISREIAHLLGGEIQAASRVGEGSTFTLLLPVDAFPEGGVHGVPAQGGTPVHELTPRPSREVALLDDEAFAAKKVLIVDD